MTKEKKRKIKRNRLFKILKLTPKKTTNWRLVGKDGVYFVKFFMQKAAKTTLTSELCAEEQVTATAMISNLENAILSNLKTLKVPRSPSKMYSSFVDHKDLMNQELRQMEEKLETVTNMCDAADSECEFLRSEIDQLSAK